MKNTNIKKQITNDKEQSLIIVEITKLAHKFGLGKDTPSTFIKSIKITNNNKIKVAFVNPTKLKEIKPVKVKVAKLKEIKIKGKK